MSVAHHEKVEHATFFVPLVAVPNSGEGKIAAQTCTSLNFRSAALAVVCVGASDQSM
jgi:hypothetical protein